MTNTEQTLATHSHGVERGVKFPWLIQTFGLTPDMQTQGSMPVVDFGIQRLILLGTDGTAIMQLPNGFQLLCAQCGFIAVT